MTSRLASAAIRRRSAHHSQQQTTINSNGVCQRNDDHPTPIVSTSPVNYDGPDDRCDDDDDSDQDDGQKELCDLDQRSTSAQICNPFMPNTTSTPSRRTRRHASDAELSGLDCGSTVSSILSESQGRTQLTATSPITATGSTLPRFRAPILGYEVVEQRAKFTVFKIRVNYIPSKSTEGWFVFRRYTDFVRLHQKLKLLFPSIRFELPPKRWFRDNFDPAFLDERLRGLQTFIDNVLLHSASSESLPVSEFFCLDDSPNSLHDSIEESRARCETLEDLVWSLKLELHEKRTEVEILRTQLALTKARKFDAHAKMTSTTTMMTSSSSASAIENGVSSTAANDDASTLSSTSVRKSETESESSSFNNESQLYCTALDGADLRRVSTLMDVETTPAENVVDDRITNKISDLSSVVDTNGNNQMVS